MSAGGQRGIDVSGVTGLRLQNASDFTHRTYLQDIYQGFNSNSRNQNRNETPNSAGYFLDFIQGVKEVGRTDISASSCVACAGLPYQYRSPFTFRF
jgi:hypothetical protein